MTGQGGTCVFAGDSHKRIDDVAAAAQKRLGCKVFKRKKFYRKSGYSQVTALSRRDKVMSSVCCFKCLARKGWRDQLTSVL